MVDRLLKARCYLDGDVSKAQLGSCPSFVWHSIYRAPYVILKDSRWLVGNGKAIKVWSDRWIPRPRTLQVISPRQDQADNIMVSTLIGYNSGSWNLDAAASLLLPCDVEGILSLPLCCS